MAPLIAKPFLAVVLGCSLSALAQSDDPDEPGSESAESVPAPVVVQAPFYMPRRNDPTSSDWDMNVYTEMSSRGGARYGVELSGAISDHVRVWLSHSDGEGIDYVHSRASDNASFGAGFEFRNERTRFGASFEKGPARPPCRTLPPMAPVACDPGYLHVIGP